MNKYPRIGNRFMARKGGTCHLCQQPQASWRIAVQVSHMRGDDEVYKVHHGCINGKGNSELLTLLLQPKETA